MIMSSYFNVFAPKNDKDLCWYRPKRLEGIVCDFYSSVEE